MPETLLTIDLSTSCTGWAFWIDGRLDSYGTIIPKVKGISKLVYPMSSLRRIISIAASLRKLTVEKNPDKIYIEEVNRGISRLTQKSLDAMHYFVLLNLAIDGQYDKLRYIDSDGRTGWRTILGLRLTKEQRAANKKRSKNTKKLTKKHLACTYVNATLGTSFDVDANPKDADIVDAIGIGLAIFKAKLLDFDP